MLRKFLLTSGIAVAVFGAINVFFALSSGRFDIPDLVGVSLYVIVFYLAPAAFVVGTLGSIVCVIKSKMGS